MKKIIIPSLICSPFLSLVVLMGSASAQTTDPAPAPAPQSFPSQDGTSQPQGMPRPDMMMHPENMQPGGFPQGPMGDPRMQGSFDPGRFDSSKFDQGRFGPNMMGDPRFHGGGEQDEARMQQMQKEGQERMLRGLKQGSREMERPINMVERRVKSLQSRGAVIPAELQQALQEAKELIGKVKSATTIEEVEALPMDAFGTLMETINESMQKAEMSTQFPRMQREANNMVKRHQTMLKRAETRASRLKIDVSALLDAWRKEVEDMVQGISEAQQTFKDGNVDDAVEILKDKVFDAGEDLGNRAQLFEMIANSARMFKEADREIKRFSTQLARLKKAGNDTAEAQELLNQAKTKIAEMRQAVLQPDADAETLFGSFEELQDLKEEFFEVMFGLTGQQLGPQHEAIPGIEFKPLEASRGLSPFIRRDREESERNRPQCRIDALSLDVPGECRDVFEAIGPQPNAGVPSTPSSPGEPAAPPANLQSLRQAIDGLPSGLQASLLGAVRQYITRSLGRK